MRTIWNWLKHFWNAGPDLTQSEIDQMDIQATQDIYKGEQQMKIPPYGEPEKKK